MNFFYRARDKEGNIKTGTVVSGNQVRAEQLLEENNLTIISLEKRETDFFSQINPFGKSVKNKDLVLFSRQLATLISAHVPIIQSLRILQEQLSSKYLLIVTTDLIASVENGEPLSLAMSRHEKVFSGVYTSLIKSGEASGSLDKSLGYLADQLEKDYELRAKVKTAMTYPAFVLVALAVVGILMFKFVLPNLTSVLEEQGGSLPTISVYLIAFTKFFNVWWWAVIMGMGLFFLAIKFYISTARGRYVWDKAKIHLPILGDVFQKIYLARFARNLSTLMAGGIPIINALTILSETISNVIYRDIIMDAANQVSAGKSISEGLAGHAEFPNIVTQMVKVGEQTAQLDVILGKLALFYEKEVDAKVSTLTTLLEPIIMIILGLGVGALVAGVLLPIYNLASTG